ncbi:MAG: sugar transferase, partial [Pseudomonadales bacterium]|nr:sugar transferase [Pseudomonadales bacterium]
MAKRLFDIAVAFLCLLMLLPLLLLIAAIIRLKLGSPVIYRQRRPGLRGEIFVIYKFRSMRDALDAAGHPLPDADRLGGFGKLLRSTSLDELPELWNVLKGDMSLVG